MGKGDFAQNPPHCGCLGMTSKVRTTGKCPLKGEGAQPQTSLESSAQTQTGEWSFAKEKMAESAKTTRPFSEAGGGGRIYGQNSAKQSKTFTFSHFHIYILPI
jgi:hypothetical protein